MTTPVKLPSSDASVSGCGAWQHQLNAQQLMNQDADLVAYLNTVPPGIDYFQWQGAVWKYVNNEDGSVTTEPDVPKGNAGIFLCTALAKKGWSRGAKIAAGVGAAVVLVGGATAIVIYTRRKGRR